MSDEDEDSDSDESLTEIEIEQKKDILNGSLEMILCKLENRGKEKTKVEASKFQSTKR